ncbi:NUDIX domain-containing protein [Orbus sasakiae]|uniref:NUDIX domain-containing protein n=1 Tax=Orbus sasakiae TaxID=1078475 RepID=A0ABP9N3V9_9GAMM
MKQSNIIHIAAAIITNYSNEMLLVRKQNSPYFMQAGGKIEPTESPIHALVRELHEELQLVIPPQQLHYVGKFSESAANEANHRINAHLFSMKLAKISIKAHAELAEVGWYSMEQAQHLCLAPLTEKVILPIVQKNKPAH